MSTGIITSSIAGKMVTNETATLTNHPEAVGQFASTPQWGATCNGASITNVLTASGNTATFTPTSQGAYVITVIIQYYNVNHTSLSTCTSSITIEAILGEVVEVTYVQKTVNHTLTATTTNTNSLKWQESDDNETWTDIEGATAQTYIAATATSAEYVSTDTPPATSPEAYEKYIRCIATNGSATATSNVLHIVHTGSGTPTVT